MLSTEGAASSNVMHLSGERSLEFNRTLIMGIINVTGDSFYKPSRKEGVAPALDIAVSMASDGADILDIGGESTRPGSDAMPLSAELDSVLPVIRAIRGLMPQIPISVDTRKAVVAKLAIEAGADIVNDVSGLELQEDSDAMLNFLQNERVPYILTHTRGTPDIMQLAPNYDDFLRELMVFFIKKTEMLLRSGVQRNRIIIDPGLGFGKRYQDNIEILANLEQIKELGYPVLIGASRKSFIGQAMGIEKHLPEDCLEGTLAVSSLCAAKGINILRVHDVKENKRAVMMINAIKKCTR